MCDLISSDGLTWNSQALHDNLLPMDEKAVRKIPLGKLREDLWAWSAEKRGMYTVKSAYHLLAGQARLDEIVKNNIANISSCDNNPTWQKLWKLKVTPKIKTFWWRVINDFLPVGVNLARRHIDTQNVCMDCKCEEETVFHVLVKCTFARLFWQSFQELYGFKLPHLHPVTWAQRICIHELEAVAP